MFFRYIGPAHLMLKFIAMAALADRLLETRYGPVVAVKLDKYWQN